MKPTYRQKPSGVERPTAGHYVLMRPGPMIEGQAYPEHWGFCGAGEMILHAGPVEGCPQCAADPPAEAA